MNDIAFFCQRVGFRTEVAAVFTDAMRALAAIGEERTLHAAVCAYLKNPNMKAADAAALLAAVAERLGLSPYTLNALFIMKVYLLGKDAYIARYSEEIFWDTAADLVCKTDECIASDDAYIKYSGYTQVFEYAASALYSADKNVYFDMLDTVSEKYIYEALAYNDFMDTYKDSTISNVSSSVNDAFQQMQGQSAGIKSYGLVVDLAAAYFRDSDK